MQGNILCQIIESQNFFRLEFERLKEILDNDKLNVRTEDEVLYIIDAWIGKGYVVTLATTFQASQQ